MRARAGMLVAGLALMLAGLPAAPAAVAAEEQIADLSVTAVVAADTTLTLTETIRYDFGDTIQRGIYRDIPMVEELASGDVRQYLVEVLSVRLDGADVPYVLEEQDGYLRVYVGDPEGFVMDVREYAVEYRVSGALQALSADDAALIGGGEGDAELYWNFVGSGWQVPIARAQATLAGPADVLAVDCFAGAYGSDERCPVEVTGSTVGFGPVSLAPGGALTGAAAWPASAFERPIVQDIREGPVASAIRGALIGAGLGALAIGILAGAAVALRRRDAGARVGAPLTYGPPCGLAPAEMSAALTGVGFPSTSLLATLLDFAARGWVHLDVGRDDVVRLRREKGADRLRDWERELLDAVFDGKRTASLDKPPLGLPITMSAIGMGLVDAVVAAGYRNPDGGRADRRWVGVGVGGGLLTLTAGAWLLFSGPALVPAALAVAGACLVVGSIAAAVITPRTQTPTSARFLSEVAGLTIVLGTDAAASRQVFAQQSGLAPAAILVTMLPYAVALGLEDSWIAAFPDLGPDELSATGLGVSEAALLSAFVAAGLSGAMNASTFGSSNSSSDGPGWRPSGGSGLSGRGFAGGGGGGGGGGTW